MKKSISIFLLISSIVLFSCGDKNKTDESMKFSSEDPIVGLASPIQLETGTTLVKIKDYVPENKKIEAIITDPGIKAVLSKDSLELSLKIISADLPRLSTLKLKIAGNEYSILLKKSEKLRHKMSFDPKGKIYKTVQMKGEMNAWNPNNTVLKENNGIWEAEIEVKPGTYQYLFVVDGIETQDPSNPNKQSNGMGGMNSVLTIGKNDQKEFPVISTGSYDDRAVYIHYTNKVSKLMVFFQNYELDERFISITDNSFKVLIPQDEKNTERTYLRVWAYNDYGISNDILIPLHKGKVLDDVKNLSRTDFHSSIIYNTFVDRFYDGDPSNNRPTKDKGIHPKANYHGGDIKGITQKIESGYFEDLGINTLWVSPIVKNPETAWGMNPNPKTKFSAYHGYWPISFTLIDSRFGTDQEFKQLVETAHKHNMNVILDFVAHHVHQDHPYYKAHKDYTTSLYLPDGTLNTERWDDHRLTTWFDVFLPTLDLSKPEVSEMLADSAVYWIDTYNLDGFRHDATKHIPEVFWQTLTYKLKTKVIIPKNRKLYQIGETYGSPELISSYISTGQLDAQFDFNVYDACVAAVTGNSSFENLARVLKTSEKYYGSHHLMGNITGNQDRGRFISYASGSLSFSENAKLAGWTREVGVLDSVGYKKCAILNAIVSTIPGIPVIFYGDEIGIPGGNDPDNRKMMRFENLNKKENELKSITKTLLQFRKKSMPLMYGDFTIIEASDGMFVYSRSYFGKMVYIVINSTKEEKNLSIKTEIDIQPNAFKTLFNSKFTIKDKRMDIILPGNSFELLYN